MEITMGKLIGKLICTNGGRVGLAYLQVAVPGWGLGRVLGMSLSKKEEVSMPSICPMVGGVAKVEVKPGKNQKNGS